MRKFFAVITASRRIVFQTKVQNYLFQRRTSYMSLMLRNVFRSSAQNRKVRSRRSQRRLFCESLEVRQMLTTTWVVDVNDPTADEPGDNLFAQIQEAVDAASPGDEIMVHAGIYEPFTVEKDNLAIGEASNNADPVIDATGADAGITINANGVKVQGLTVSNANLFGFRVSGDDNTLVGNTAVGNRIGFQLATNDSAVTGNLAIGNLSSGFSIIGEHNRVTGNSAVDGQGNGFRIGGRDSRFSGNTASGNATDGFTLDRSTNSTLTGNVSRDNGGNGFGFRMSFGNTLRGNVAEGNTRSGYSLTPTAFIRPTDFNFPQRTVRIVLSFVSGSDNNTFQGNVATGNGDYGFYLRGVSGNIFRGNSALENGSDGFRAETANIEAPPNFGPFRVLNAGELLASVPSDANVFKGNISEGNGGWGFYVDELFANLFEDNDAEGNVLGDFSWLT